MKVFDRNSKALTEQFKKIQWMEDSGLSEAELEREYDALMRNPDGFSKAMLKAKTFALILERSRIAVDPEDIFQDKLWGGNLMLRQREQWEQEVKTAYLPDETERIDIARSVCAYKGNSDFGHTSPNSRLLLQIGFRGLLQRIEEASVRPGLTPKQKDFYEACKITLQAMICFTKRLADATRPYNADNCRALENIAAGAPSNMYEAMQLVIIYFFLHEYIAGTRVRSLGRLDVLLYPFYQKDIKDGTFTKEEITELLKFFLNKFWAADVDYGLPFCLGGIDSEGNEVTNELSYLIVETYRDMDIYSPKIHIRVSDKTPVDFVKLVLQCIRGGSSSFVFVNDAIGIQSLMDVGIEERDARDYIPIGCYEPAVWGVEIGCTGNGGVMLPKAVEFVVTNGVDLRTGARVGVQTGKIESYEDFINALKIQISYMAGAAMDYVCKLERHYARINPDLIHSSMYDRSVELGLDVYEGGAKYNSSSMYFYSIATFVDAVAAVKKLVFDERRLSFEELCTVLKDNWAGHEQLRAVVRNLPEKYGNDNAYADAIAREFSDFCADLVNNKPNGRGGVFKAALFSIDHCFRHGQMTMATPDGRYAGDPNSKNLCATTAMDKKGITALINSVTKMDHSKFPTGSVLDIVLHPSAVQGEDGLEAFYWIVKTYMNKGGFALHGNVFCPEDLRAAQKDPEKYANLQVRVCGWNAYFVNLSKAEQDAFILQAENNQ